MKKLLLASLLATLCSSAYSHDIWIKADRHEINSDEQKHYSVDVSRSAQTFVAEANHEVKTLNMTSPNGENSQLSAAYSGKVKEVFDLEFNAPGTYHLVSPMTQVFLSFYHDQQGKKHKIRMPKSQWHTLPEGAKPIRTVEKQIITETYISYNGFSEIKQAETKALQIKLAQHPNKIRAGQPLMFTLTFNGKPVKEAEVALTSVNEFYYQESDKVELNLTQQDNGIAKFAGQKPGRYLLGVEFGMALDNNPHADDRSVERFLSFQITQ